MSGSKTCKVCGESKAAEKFVPQRAICRDCNNAERRARYAIDPEYRAKNTARNSKRWPSEESQREHNKKRRESGRSRADHLWNRFRLTPEEYDAIWERQGRMCPICKRGDESLVLCVDHDHSCCPTILTCGRCIRGILCKQCNYGIGFLQDGLDRLERAASYLMTEQINV